MMPGLSIEVAVVPPRRYRSEHDEVLEGEGRECKMCLTQEKATIM